MCWQPVPRTDEACCLKKNSTKQCTLETVILILGGSMCFPGPLLKGTEADVQLAARATGACQADLCCVLLDLFRANWKHRITIHSLVPYTTAFPSSANKGHHYVPASALARSAALFGEHTA